MRVCDETTFWKGKPEMCIVLNENNNKVKYIKKFERSIYIVSVM